MTASKKNYSTTLFSTCKYTFPWCLYTKPRHLYLYTLFKKKFTMSRERIKLSLGYIKIVGCRLGPEIDYVRRRERPIVKIGKEVSYKNYNYNV